MNLLDLVERRGIVLRRAGQKDGGEYQGPCPGCGDGGKKDSNRFHVWPYQKPDNKISGTFWCRQCGKNGDVITFLMAFDGLSYPEALKSLGIQNTYAQPLTPKPPQLATDNVQKHIPRDTSGPPPAAGPELWQAKAAVFVGWAEEKLHNNAKQLAYLKHRGIRQDTCRRFRLGYNPGQGKKDLYRTRESWGLETILKTNGRKKKLWFPRGLVIPLLSPDGSIRRVRIRRPGEDEPRYWVIQGSSMEMLIIPAPIPRVWVTVEAELDAILVAQECGDVAGVIPLGSSSTRPDSGATAVLKSASLILNALDNDKAGDKEEAWWQLNFEGVERLRVPKGKDPGEAYAAGVDLRGWVMDALPPPWRQYGPVAKKKKPEEGATAAKEVEGGATKTEEPPGVRELKDLLAKHPVTIHRTEKRVHIRESQAWVATHWEVSKRISELVFMDEAVTDWIERDGSYALASDAQAKLDELKQRTQGNDSPKTENDDPGASDKATRTTKRGSKKEKPAEPKEPHELETADLTDELVTCPENSPTAGDKMKRSYCVDECRWPEKSQQCAPYQEGEAK